MTTRGHAARNVILAIGIPAFIAGVIVAIILFEVPGTLFSAVEGNDPTVAPAPQVARPVAGSPPERTPAPSPSPDGSPVAAPVESNLLADPAFIETSIAGMGRYVSIASRSGLWAMQEPTVLARTTYGVWREGEGMPFAGETIRLTFHESVSDKRCIYPELEAKQPFQLKATSGGRAETLDVPEGLSVVPTLCTPAQNAGEAMRISLTPVQPVPDDTFPRLRGVWLVPKDGVPVAGAAVPPAACGDDGLLIAPGVTLHVRGLAEKGSVLDVRIDGEGLGSLLVSMRTSPGARKVLRDPSGEQASSGPWDGLGRWPLNLSRQRPVEVTVSLPSQSPGAVCVHRMALVHPPAPPGLDMQSVPRARGVIFILLDTLRHDALKSFNPRSPVEAPRLDELISRSVRFTNATAQSNYTKPTVASMLTGQYPHINGGLGHKNALHDDVPLITELLDEAGVQTVGLFSNRFLNDKFNFMRGWDVEQHVNSYEASLDGRVAADAWVDFIEGYVPEDPFFFYIHLMDPHAPYRPATTQLEIKYVGHRVVDGRFTPRATAKFILDLRRGKVDPLSDEELKVMQGLYRGDVASLDITVGRILDALQQAGLMDGTMVVVASDHGEEFLEHGYLGHGTNIQPEITHVPVWIRFPSDSLTGVHDGLVGQVDLAPTVLDALGVPVPAGMAGRSLIDVLDAPATPGDPPAFLMQHWNGVYGLRLGHWMAIATRRNTSLARIQDHQVWYQDPDRHPVLWLYLRERLALLTLDTREGAALEKAADVGEDTRDQLEALGYVLR